MPPAATIGLAEAKNKLSELLDRVERGEVFTITRHDEAVARLIPAKRPSRAAAYLDLAPSRGVALASLDTDLRAAARNLGVKVLPPTLRVVGSTLGRSGEPRETRHAWFAVRSVGEGNGGVSK